MPCPTCGETAERRISAGGGLLFKGSGFYITDYGKDGKKDQRAKASTSTESSKAPDASSATKPADSSSKASDSPKPAAPSKSSDSK